MAGAHNMSFPSSRVLAGWWKQLQPAAPTALWVGHLFLQRVEALVHLVASQPLDQLSHLLLQAIDIEQRAGGTQPLLERLQARLHFPPPILNQLLRNLGNLSLVSGAEGGWTFTEHGTAALASMHFPQAKTERRVFTFLERLDPFGHRLADPAFLPLALDRGQAWHPAEHLPFRFEWLQACQSQSREWKRTHGFPEQLDKIVLPGADLKDWQNVVVLRHERLVAVFAQIDAVLSAFLAKPDGWTLAANEPLVSFGAELMQEYADLMPAVAVEDLERAWRHLADSHHLTPEESASARLEHTGLELKIHVPESLHARIRLHRDDCTLLGEGCVRPLVRVTIANGRG